MARTIIFLIFPHCEKVLDLQVMLLGADKQGGQPGGCEGQGGEGHVLRREDEDGTLCRCAQDCSDLVQVGEAPLWNRFKILTFSRF